MYGRATPRRGRGIPCGARPTTVATEFARREAIGLPEAEGRAAERSQEAERDPPGDVKTRRHALRLGGTRPTIRSRGTHASSRSKYHSSELNSLVIAILVDALVWY